jgi:hypothetical protein
MMINNLKTYIIQKRCKHVESVDSECPFTMKTYTNCINCGKRLKVISNI